MATTGTDMSRMREADRLSVVGALLGNPPSAVTERASPSGLSRSVAPGAVRPALNEVESRLVSEGLAAPAAPPTPTVGRGHTHVREPSQERRNEGTAQ
ncbi:hypothetical protein [Streptomyces sp. CCM_MD2014]|uniref:hypothetical protein n=1 Tax=Streptomyces sp. CCM_MD2014 TaxID=1561022 RepID=UPI00052AD8C7|nr:hypothetical protein [Streptomyces sp. CCM_MD2014]AIV38349.1 hypothetical protein NI25_36435 [Streptomyces sp. CCM_MD2014]